MLFSSILMIFLSDIYLFDKNELSIVLNFYISKYEFINSFSFFIAFSMLITLTSFSMYKPDKLSIERYIDEKSIRFVMVALSILILFSGIFSSYLGLGHARLSDYETGAAVSNEGADYDIPRVISYSMTLMVPVSLYLLTNIIKTGFSRLNIFIAISLLPLFIENIISARRQTLAPIVLMFFLFFVYNTRIKRKFLIYIISLVIFIIIFGIQYQMRNYFLYDSLSTSGIYETFLEPQIGELTWVGSITYQVWCDFLTDKLSYTYGINYIVAILNSVPFFKIGNLFFSSFNSELFNLVNYYSPYGAFPVFGDLLLSLGVLGITAYSALIGIIIKKFEPILAYSINAKIHGFRFYYLFSLISFFIIGYRNSLSGLIGLIITFSILYWFVVYLVSSLMKFAKKYT